MRACRAPGDAAITRELAALRNTIREERKAQAKLFSGKLEGGLGKDGAPDTPPPAQAPPKQAGQIPPGPRPRPTNVRKKAQDSEKNAKPEPVPPQVAAVRSQVHSSGGRAGVQEARGQRQGVVAVLLAWLWWLLGLLGLRLRARPARVGK